MPKSRSAQKILLGRKKETLTVVSRPPAAQSEDGRTPQYSQEEANWRASRVAEDARIAKTLALHEYRLKPRDLDGLAFTKKRVTSSGYRHDMFLYSEREVERKAWQRHGGPEGFDAYLDKLRKRHMTKKDASSPFVQPASYNPGGATRARHRYTDPDPVQIPDKNPMCVYPNVVPPWEPYDETFVSAERARIREAMPPWLWEACTRSLHELYESQITYGWLERALSEGSKWDELSPMKTALTIASLYPVRPPELLPPSPSIDRLRAVLASAARIPEVGVGYGQPVDGLEDLHMHFPDLLEWYDWSAEYLERLFAAILDVIEEHGFGAEGWEGVQWEVYDKACARFQSRTRQVHANLHLRMRSTSSPCAMA
uniref:Succinate-semialdehyde dehydrogenase (EC) n=1 Tax=Ganoderma boninense TaxID=34458 RepID=A0A5K1K412_9APHY|nr:Succinate-semialdehyde dehydrogenase (EC [Ganoderma boninense]